MGRALRVDTGQTKQLSWAGAWNKPLRPAVHIAYLINQYPLISHSFIRREIQALEARGLRIHRFSIRRMPEVIDPGDKEELQKTHSLLGQGSIKLLGALLGVVFRAPLKFLSALALAIRVGRRSDRGILVHLIYLSESCLLLKWLSEAQVSHLHAHFGTNPATVAMLCRELGGPPYSFTVHGPEEFDKPEFLALGEKIQRASFVVAISSFGKSQLCRWARFQDWPKLEVVRCGLSDEYLGAGLSKIPNVLRFVCIARLNEQKGHLLLVEAAAQLAKEGRQFEVVLVGDGPMRAEIEAEISRRNVSHCFQLKGWQPGHEVHQTLLKSRAMVLPSFAEGLPVVLMEALALGRPVIATAIAGIPELVENGVNGWLIPAGAAEPLANAMRAVLDASTEALEAMGKAGAERVARMHNIETEAAQLAALFEKAEKRAVQ